MSVLGLDEITYNVVNAEKMACASIHAQTGRN